MGPPYFWKIWTNTNGRSNPTIIYNNKKKQQKEVSWVLCILLGGGFKYFLFSPLFGEDSHFDEHIFQMG